MRATGSIDGDRVESEPASLEVEVCEGCLGGCACSSGGSGLCADGTCHWQGQLQLCPPMAD